MLTALLSDNVNVIAADARAAVLFALSTYAKAGFDGTTKSRAINELSASLDGPALEAYADTLLHAFTAGTLQLQSALDACCLADMPTLRSLPPGHPLTSVPLKSGVQSFSARFQIKVVCAISTTCSTHLPTFALACRSQGSTERHHKRLDQWAQRHCR